MDMVETDIDSALQTKCERCGSYTRFDPESQTLKCQNCGFTQALNLTPGKIVENDFEYWATHFNGRKKEKETETESLLKVRQVRCKQCGAKTSMPSNTSGMSCAFCGTPLILSETSLQSTWLPNYVLPFSITEKRSQESFRKWIGSRWFLPNKVKRGDIATDSFKGIYLPFWSYDADTETQYTGERGIDRTEVDKDEKGNIRHRAVTDWYYTFGDISHSFDDLLVPASHTLPKSLMNDLTHWDTKNCLPYSHEYIAGFITEIYQQDFLESISEAKMKMEAELEQMVRNDIGGDRQRIHSMDTEYNNVMFKLMLLPLWISAFKYNGKLYQFVVNGRTGKVAGNYPKSFVKIFFFILGILLIIVIFYLLSGKA
ncbi:hypothetical protein [Porphyromonas canoris]|uniref:Zinc finger domain, LSD1 subclass subfamily n=1 Tax=Porphyromonas canoris TaxID=36875 RepID=A0ABR4XMZ2_9PORP|nr:hypothetical protein [Porphyromonas canoris]KGN93319.1 zinc finger domain, LSD1 subclass subfamily [Porphyromonas canoris]